MSFRGRVSRAVAIWALVGIAAVTLFGVWLALGNRGPLPLDQAWHAWVTVEQGSVAYAVAVALAEIGSGVGVTACLVIAVAALCVFRRWRDALSVAFAVGLGAFVPTLTKLLVVRSRPPDPLYAASGLSFPSGHSMSAAALATSIMLVILAWTGISRTLARVAVVAAIAWVLVMMWSRTALHVHWLSDTLAGALLGLCVAVLSRRLWVGDGSPTRSL